MHHFTHSIMSKTEAAIAYKEGYKKTKLGWIPEDWDIANLDNRINLESGQHLNKEDYFFKEVGIPYFTGPTDVTHLIENVAKWTNIQNKVAYKGEVIITVKGSGVGSLALCKLPKVAMGRQLMSVNGNNTDNDYLFHILSNKKYKFQQLASGNMIPGLSRKDILLTKGLFPSLLEQKAIASCLNTWDTAIQNLTALIANKALQKKGLMQQLLTGKKRLPGFDGEWEIDTLGTYFSERRETGLDNLELLSIGEAGVYSQSNSNKKDTSNNNKSKYKRICKGDIGYNTMRMWQGRSALSSLEGIVSPAYTIVKPLKNADSVFFSYLFKLDEIIHKFYRNSQGMVSDTWMCKFKDFKIVKFNAPPSKKEQTAIANVLQKADQEIELLTTQRDQLQLQKKGLMQQLLTGKKRLKF